MRKEEFDRRTKEVKAILDNYYKDKEIAYVLLLQTPNEQKKYCYIDLLSNLIPPDIAPFANTIIKKISSLIGRQN